MGLLKFLVKTITIASIVVLLLAYSPLFLDCEPQAVSRLLPKKFEGALAGNDRLSAAEKLFHGELRSPESLAVLEGVIYTGLYDGHIIGINGDKFKPVIRTGENCEGQWEEWKCGRPLGVRFHNKQLYVVDAYYGLLRVDVKKGTKTVLLPSSTQVEGSSLTFMNDLAIDSNGIIYFTQSSTKWNISTSVYSLLEHDSSGRLLSFDVNSGHVSVLAKGLQFANGVEISRDGSKLLYAETSGFRVMQYGLSGPNKGRISVFIQNLPGEPDNIRSSPRGGYWIPIVAARTQDTPIIIDRLGPYPRVRKIIMRVQHVIGNILTSVAHFVPQLNMKELAFDVITGRILASVIPAYGMIIRVDEDGKIIESMQSPDGKVAFISQVLEHDGHLYLGSFGNPFLARMKL